MQAARSGRGPRPRTPRTPGGGHLCVARAFRITIRGMTERADTSPLAVYQAHCERGELAYQVDAAGNAVFYPRVVAPGSGGALEWKVSAGLGTVHATTTLFPRNAEPYDVSLIDVDEGFRMMSRVEGIDPAEVRIGMRVRVRMLPGSEDQPAYPVFEPLADAP